MKLLQPTNLVLAFLLEVAMLAAYCYGGFHLSIKTSLQIIIGLGVPIIIIFFWSFFLAPKANHRLKLQMFVSSKIILFSGAVFILFEIQKNELAMLLGIFTILNLGLAVLFRQT